MGNIWQKETQALEREPLVNHEHSRRAGTRQRPCGWQRRLVKWGIIFVFALTLLQLLLIYFANVSLLFVWDTVTHPVALWHVLAESPQCVFDVTDIGTPAVNDVHLSAWDREECFPPVELLWSKGWYQLPHRPAGQPLSYFLVDTEATLTAQQMLAFFPNVIPPGERVNLWLRATDMTIFATKVLPQLTAPGQV